MAKRLDSNSLKRIAKTVRLQETSGRDKRMPGSGLLPIEQICCLQNAKSRYGYAGGGIAMGQAVPADLQYDIYTIAGWQEDQTASGIQFVAPIPGVLISKDVPMLGFGNRVAGESLNAGVLGRYTIINGKYFLTTADELVMGVQSCDQSNVDYQAPYSLASSGAT